MQPVRIACAPFLVSRLISFHQSVVMASAVFHAGHSVVDRRCVWRTCLLRRSCVDHTWQTVLNSTRMFVWRCIYSCTTIEVTRSPRQCRVYDYDDVVQWVVCQSTVNSGFSFGWRRISNVGSTVHRVSVVVKSSRCSCLASVRSLLSGSSSVLSQPFAGSLPSPSYSCSSARHPASVVAVRLW